MKWSRIVFGLFVVGVYTFGISAYTYAETISGVEQRITVHATVAPARYIVVRSNDPQTVAVVFSNTRQAVQPQVYINSVAGSRQPLTPHLLDQYQSLLTAHPGFGIGSLQPEHHSSATNSKPAPATRNKQILPFFARLQANRSLAAFTQIQIFVPH